MEYNVRGLVIRETAYGEADKLLTMLTGELGKITVAAKGSRSMRSRYMSASQLFAYSDCTLVQRGERFWLREGTALEVFYPLRMELSRSALAQYYLDVCGEICAEGEREGAEDFLRLMLNSLYALAQQPEKPQRLCKAAFEFRAAALGGFMPDLSGCALCGRSADPGMRLDVPEGRLLCAACAGRLEKEEAERFRGRELPPPRQLASHWRYPVSPGVLRALRYLLETAVERLFCFSLPEAGLREFSAVCEAYLLNHLDRSFRTLEFWRETERSRRPERES